MEGSFPNVYRLSSVDDDKENTPPRPHLPIQPIRPIHLDNLRATSTSLSALDLQQARLLLFPYFIECSEPLSYPGGLVAPCHCHPTHGVASDH